ncbi:MAG TPA: alpha/beta hydrolase [Chthoniobacterales bacterium]
MSRFGRIIGIAAVCLLAGCAAYGPPRGNEKITRNVEFAAPGGRPLRMDLYVPQTGKPAPVVLWIFGGSWKFGSKGYHVNVRDLTRSGIAVASIEYRLSGQASFPAQLEDCKAAVAWLRTHGAKYGIDPNRIGASGESAGGHLAALLGTTEERPNIDAVCALYPPTNLVSLGRMYSQPGRRSDIEALLNGPIEEKLPLARAASPVEHVSRSSPPFLLIHGAKDSLVPLSQSEELHTRLKRAGVESTLLVAPEQPHWFKLTPAQVAQVAAFFRKHFAME